MTEATNSPPQEESRALVPIIDGSLQLRSLDDVWRLSKVLALSRMTPYETPEQNAAVIVASLELGISPMRGMQCIFPVNGRTTIYGDTVLELALSHPDTATLEEWWEIDGARLDGPIADPHALPEERLATYAALCRLETAGGRVVTWRFDVPMARKAGLWIDTKPTEWKARKSPWWRYPSRMLQWKARNWAIRDGNPAALRGFPPNEDVAERSARDVEAVVLPAGEGDALSRMKSELDGAEAEADVEIRNTDEGPEEDSGLPGVEPEETPAEGGAAPQGVSSGESGPRHDDEPEGSAAPDSSTPADEDGAATDERNRKLWQDRINELVHKQEIDPRAILEYVRQRIWESDEPLEKFSQLSNPQVRKLLGDLVSGRLRAWSRDEPDSVSEPEPEPEPSEAPEVPPAAAEPRPNWRRPELVGAVNELCMDTGLSTDDAVALVRLLCDKDRGANWAGLTKSDLWTVYDHLSARATESEG